MPNSFIHVQMQYAFQLLLLKQYRHNLFKFMHNVIYEKSHNIVQIYQCKHVLLY